MYQIASLQEEKQQLEEALKHAEKEGRELLVLKAALESQLEDMQVRTRKSLDNLNFKFSVYLSHYCFLYSYVSFFLKYTLFESLDLTSMFKCVLKR